MNPLSKAAADAVARYAGNWGLPSSAERVAKRAGSSLDDINAFYGSVLPWMEEILIYLNQFPLASLPDEARPIAWTALAMCEVDNPVRWKAATLSSGFDVLEMVEKSSFYDSALP